jgi:DNA-binding NarL/FixJ family response regulator
LPNQNRASTILELHSTNLGGRTSLVAISLLVAAPSGLGNEMLCRAFNRRRKQFNVVATLEDDATAGLQALRELRLTRSSTRVVMLLDCSEPTRVIEAFSNGARGVFCTSQGFEVLCKCIRSVHAGQVWADSSQLHWVVQALGEREPVRMVSATGTPLLTKREEQIVRMVAEGLPNSEICASLGVSTHTVKNHLFRIYEKLGVSNRVELVLYALSRRDAC